VCNLQAFSISALIALMVLDSISTSADVHEENLKTKSDEPTSSYQLILKKNYFLGFGFITLISKISYWV
jgi:hypothetical protein